jgi:ABC-type Fe3+/spermidine/putrescine transport system ATPase subunit
MKDVELNHISYSYGKTAVLRDICLTIWDGEFFTLLGPSGCGKTTLLRIVAGFLIPDTGNVRIGDDDITRLKPEKRNMGIVFQNYALFPNLNVRENVLYGLKVRRTPKAEAEEKCAYYLDLTGLSEYRNRRIQELSGGQQQRVAVARALAIEPQMLLLDEPMSSLDAALRVRMREEIRSIQRKIGITTLFITHDQQEALSVSDRIAVMREGSILQVGTPTELYNHPNQEFVASFVGTCNKIGGRMVRPEHLCLLPSGSDGIPVTVTGVQFSGMYYFYTATDGKQDYRIAEMNRGTDSLTWEAGDAAVMSDARGYGADGHA